MRKLLLLDADVIIDLHTLGLFGKIRKAYDICLTRSVFNEAGYYTKEQVRTQKLEESLLILHFF